uniref:cytochrome c-type biogenesis CcmF C-terminal domain-containing protein n=1 Tax=Salmonella sp. SAL04281 TaxID=3159859 RepID=UPI00397C6F74
ILPLLTEALRGAQITVGAPFFNQVNGPIAFALLLLMGVGPLLPWRRTDRERLGRAFALPVTGAIVTLPVLWLIGIREW